MKIGVYATIFIAGGSVTTVNAQTAPPNASDCAALVGLQVESGTVTAADRFAQGQSMALLGPTAPVNLCRARLRLQPTSSSDINVEVWLPETWNGKLFTHGGGGFSGGLGSSMDPLIKSTGRGYAAATSDLGHATGATAQWAYNQPEKVVDFGHRANHLVAVTTKQVISAYYGSPAQRAYFQGCSGGGREALAEVSRYPSDYDGVIAGAPPMDFGELMTQLIWNNQTMAGAPFLNAKLGTVNNAVLQQCDTLDGVQDNVLENPQACHFDPVSIQCKLLDTPFCLNQSEVGVLRKIYEGPRLANGELLIPGPSVGSEGIAWVLGGPLFSLVGGQEYYRWMVYNNPLWSAIGFNLNTNYPDSRTRVEPIVDSGNPDISAFTQRGGKLILYHGWSDPLIPSANTVRYYEGTRSYVGPTLQNNARLFMVPGMGHCEGGTGATSFDMVPHLEAWVEQGQAPDRVIAVQPGFLGSPPTLSRPLCPWPKTAHYNGSGSTNDAANFTCRE
jgi:feruloyl esterase